MLDGGKLLNGRPGPAKQTKARPAAPSKVDQRGSPKMTTSTTTGQSALTATTVHRSHKPRRPKCARATPGKVAAKVATRAPAEASSRYAPRQGKGTAAPDVVGYGAHLLPGAAAASGARMALPPMLRDESPSFGTSGFPGSLSWNPEVRVCSAAVLGCCRLRKLSSRVRGVTIASDMGERAAAAASPPRAAGFCKRIVAGL